MAEAVSQNRSRDFFKEADKVSGYKQDPPAIDGVRKYKDITELFKGKYSYLYNSNPSDQDNMDKIEEFITSQVPLSKHEDYVVSEEEVKEAVNMLKQGKSDGDKGLLSDHIINGPNILFTLIALLITTSRKHGHMPEEMLMASVASIPKDMCGNICSSDNYRGIALSSAISKINDIVVLNKYQDILGTSNMQYAFKRRHGTTMCTLVTKEVAKYYLSGDTPPNLYGNTKNELVVISCTIINKENVDTWKKMLILGGKVIFSGEYREFKYSLMVDFLGFLA
jgi:hypothetical protein